jgi:hypothetical protein
MGSLGESDAEKGGLNSLTYASPPKWECPPGPIGKSTGFIGIEAWQCLYREKSKQKLSLIQNNSKYIKRPSSFISVKVVAPGFANKAFNCTV